MAKPSRIPEFCDYSCPHAAFPPAESAGICRTMAAVHCGLLKELVNKNAPCEWRRRQEGGAGVGGAQERRRARPLRRTQRTD